MILTDTGPLIALLDRRDANHRKCVALARRLPSAPLLTTWPCFTEAMYLLGELGGPHYQATLWDLYTARKLMLLDLTASEIALMADLMRKYHDLPMDLADASLVAVIDQHRIEPLFTLDRDVGSRQVSAPRTFVSRKTFTTRL